MWLNRINNDGQKSGVYADYKYYGTGDRGGAPKESSVQWIERSLEGAGPVRVIEGTSDQIFKDITPAEAAHLPTYAGELELVNHSAGSISSEAYMKRCNRKNDNSRPRRKAPRPPRCGWEHFLTQVTRCIRRGTWCSARRCMTSCLAPACRRRMKTRGMTRCWLSINSPR